MNDKARKEENDYRINIINSAIFEEFRSYKSADEDPRLLRCSALSKYKYLRPFRWTYLLQPAKRTPPSITRSKPQHTTKRE